MSSSHFHHVIHSINKNWTYLFLIVYFITIFHLQFTYWFENINEAEAIHHVWLWQNISMQMQWSQIENSIFVWSNLKSNRIIKRVELFKNVRRITNFQRLVFYWLRDKRLQTSSTMIISINSKSIKYSMQMITVSSSIILHLIYSELNSWPRKPLYLYSFIWFMQCSYSFQAKWARNILRIELIVHFWVGKHCIHRHYNQSL